MLVKSLIFMVYVTFVLVIITKVSGQLWYLNILIAFVVCIIFLIMEYYREKKGNVTSTIDDDLDLDIQQNDDNQYMAEKMENICEQIEMTSNTSQSIISNLIQKFSDLFTQANSAAKAKSDDNMHSRLGDLTLDKQTSTHDIVKIMQNSGESHCQLIQYIRMVSQNFKTLGKFADNMREIMLETRVLSVNASIESSNGNQFSENFKFVSQEIRNLSMGGSDLVTEVTKLITNVSESMFQTEKELIQSIESNISLERDAQELMNKIFDDVNQEINSLSKSSQQCANEYIQIEKAIDEILINFQFQDRLSQELAAVTRYIKSVACQLKAPPTLRQDWSEVAFKSLEIQQEGNVEFF